MPSKAEYWTLTKEQFNEIKTQVNELGEKLLNDLQAVGFTKIKSSPDWLGLSIEKRQGDLLTLIAFSLYGELPLDFSLDLKKWDIKNPSGTCTVLYENHFSSIQDFVHSFTEELTRIKEKLQ